MGQPLIVPDSAVPYILYQRAYFRLPVTPVYRFLNKALPFQTPLYNLAVALESRFGKARIKARYAADIQREYERIQPHLPPRCSTILDIGCGVAGIDVFLSRHDANAPVNLYLLDKTRVESRVYYLFQDQAAFYNSLDAARELLMQNAVPAERIHLLEAKARNEIAVDGPVDLVLSLLSWGFHYPVRTYVDRVREVLRPDGIAILDVRKGTDGLEVLQEKFGAVETIGETEKSYRVTVRK